MFGAIVLFIFAVILPVVASGAKLPVTVAAEESGRSGRSDRSVG